MTQSLRLKAPAARHAVGAVLIGVLLTAGCSAAPDRPPATDPADGASAAAASTAVVDELAPIVAGIVDRPVVVPELLSDPSAPQLADGSAAVAVTEGIDRDAGTAASYRIVVDTARLAAAGDASRRALLAHELVHAHVQPVTDPATPLWLVEGIADAVGYAAAGTDLAAVRAGLGELTSTSGALPSDAELSSGDPQQRQTAYGRAWLAVDYVISQLGMASTVALFRTVAASGNPAAELSAQIMAVLGLGDDEFVLACHDYAESMQ